MLSSDRSEGGTPTGQSSLAPEHRVALPALSSAHALFLDIDGTLIHLADTPAQVRVDAAVTALLPALVRHLDGALALITGRSISSVDELFHGLVRPVAGQHGSERRSADGQVHRHAAKLPGLTRLRRQLGRVAAQHAGLLFEDKGSTLALHYRLAPHLGALVQGVVEDALQDLPKGAWVIQSGKCVVELRPDGRDKGTAVLEFLAEPPFIGRLPVFIGDDRTDELGFAAVETRGGWSVKVGRGPTVARHRLPSVAAVRAWLQAALDGLADSVDSGGNHDHA